MSNIIDERILSNLLSLGLDEKEAAVYSNLLSQGKAVGSSKIIEGTGLHGQFVYAALGRLEAKGLTKHSIVNGRKKFEANAPSRLTHLAEEKRFIAEQTADALSTISRHPNAQDFEMYQGEIAFTQRLYDALEEMQKGDTICIISTVWGEMFSGARPAFFSDYERERQKREIGIRFIVNEGLRETVADAKKKRFGIEFRTLPEHVSRSGIYIYRECTDFCLFGDPIAAFRFRNAQVTEGYRNFFEILWKMGRE